MTTPDPVPRGDLPADAATFLYQPSPCPQCGIIGIHACPGAPIPPMTPEQVKQLNSVLQGIFSDKA